MQAQQSTADICLSSIWILYGYIYENVDLFMLQNSESANPQENIKWKW